MDINNLIDEKEENGIFFFFLNLLFGIANSLFSSMPNSYCQFIFQIKVAKSTSTLLPVIGGCSLFAKPGKSNGFTCLDFSVNNWLGAFPTENFSGVSNYESEPLKLLELSEAGPLGSNLFIIRSSVSGSLLWLLSMGQGQDYPVPVRIARRGACSEYSLSGIYGIPFLTTSLRLKITKQ